MISDIRRHNKTTKEIKHKTEFLKTQVNERNLHRRFRSENPQISKEIEKHEFEHGEHYHYVTDEEDIFI